MDGGRALMFESVHRSITEWVFVALDDPAWGVKDERSEVSDEQRPIVIVEATGEKSTPFARGGYVQGDVQHGDTWTVTAYPATDGTPAECSERARKLKAQLDDAVTYGLVILAVEEDPDADPPVVAADEVVLGGPLTLPLWDFGEVALAADRPEEQAGAIDVISHTSRAIPDPLDDRRYTVVLEMRVRWWTGGRIRRDTAPPPTAQSIEGTYVP